MPSVSGAKLTTGEILVYTHLFYPNMKKRILFSASLFHSLNDAASVTVPTIFPILYSQQFIIKNYTHIGILSYLGLLMTFIFQILIAQAADKFEYKHLLLLSFSGICTSLVLVTFASTFGAFLVVYLIFRAFVSFYHPVGISWVSKTHPQGKIDSAMGIQSGSGNLGVLIAFISVGYLAQNFNWKLPLIVWALTGLFLGTISFISVRNTITRESGEFEKLSLSSWIETVKRIKIHILAFVFGGACWGATVYYAPSLLHHKFSIPMGKTGLYLGIWIGLGTVTTYLYGFLCKKFGRFKISLIGFLGATLFIFLLGAASGVVLATVSLFCFGTVLFLIYPAFNAFVGNTVPSRNQAQAFSVAANIQVLSGAVVNLLAGFLSDRFGINSPFLLVGILGILISLYYLSKWSELSSTEKN